MYQLLESTNYNMHSIIIIIPKIHKHFGHAYILNYKQWNIPTAFYVIIRCIATRKKAVFFQSTDLGFVSRHPSIEESVTIVHAILWSPDFPGYGVDN